MVLPHQTIALSMLQEWQYQVRLNPFLKLRHRQKSLTHAIPYTLLISQCLQKTPLTLTPEVPHKQNKHPKQKEKKNPPRHAVIFPQQTLPHQQSVCKRCLRQPGSLTVKKTSKNEEHFLTSVQNENLSCSISTEFISELMQINIATVFEKLKNSTQNAKSKHFMNFNIHLEVSKLALSACQPIQARTAPRQLCEVAHISKFCFCLSREDAHHLKTKTQCKPAQIKCAKQQVNTI